LKRSNSLLFPALAVLPFLLLAILIAVAGAPAHAAAMQAAPAATASDSAAQSAAPAQASKSEAEEDDAYRHSPIVSSLAKTLHMPLETTARLFEAINFVILALALLIPLSRLLPKVIRKRSETLRHDIESARKVTEDAKSRLNAVEAKLSKLDDEIAKLRADMEEELKHDEARMKVALEEEHSHIIASAEQEIDAAAAHARRGLRNFAAELAIGKAAQQMKLTPETDRALIAEFLAGVGDHGTNKGGQN
jgi:F-type H+-transporting ATPase subunit b